MQHTPEPWHIRLRGWLIVISSGSKPIAFLPLSPEAFVNAERIVAAVNACAAIPTQALGRHFIQSLLDFAWDVREDPGVSCLAMAASRESGPGERAAGKKKPPS